MPSLIIGGITYETEASEVTGAISVQDEGSPVVDATTLNFTGSGVVATDAGGGVVDVTISAGTGTVSSISAGTGITLTPGPITTTGSVAIDTAVVPRLNVANAFSVGPQTMPSISLPELGGTPSTVADSSLLYSLDSNGFTVLHTLEPSGKELHVMRDRYIVVRNTSGAPMTPGTVVHLSGSTGQVPNVALAKADSDNTMPAIGIMLDATNNNNFGRAMLRGTIENLVLNPGTYTDGDALYISATSAGAFTNSMPAHPYMQQKVGMVLRAHLTQGQILVDPNGVLNHGTGTHENTWIVGDTLAGTKTVSFRNTKIGDLSWTPTDNRTVTIPDASGTISLVGHTHTISEVVGAALDSDVFMLMGC
jgi:hypothetical protein